MSAYIGIALLGVFVVLSALYFGLIYKGSQDSQDSQDTNDTNDEYKE